MKGSMRRASLWSTQSFTSKFFTCPANLVTWSLGSKWVIGPMPDRPLTRPVQVSSVPTPRGVTRPKPVTTTLRRSAIRAPPDSIARAPSRTDVELTPMPGEPLLLVRVDVVDGVTHGLDVLRLLVGDLHLELLFHRHHQLDDVEAVRPEVLDEGRFRLDLVLAHTQLLRDDRLYFLLHRRRCHLLPPKGFRFCLKKFSLWANHARFAARESHVHAAIDTQNLARDVARPRRGEKEHRLGDLLGSTEPSGWNHLHHRSPRGLGDP